MKLSATIIAVMITVASIVDADEVKPQSMSFFGSEAQAQVQGTKHNTLRWIRRVCHNSLNDAGKSAIKALGKTEKMVCDCTAKEMWRRFPSVSYWVQETNPYEWNKVTKAFPEVLRECIFRQSN